MVAGRCLPLSMLAVAVLVRVATVIGDVAQLTPQLQSPPGFYLDGISTSQCLWGGEALHLQGVLYSGGKSDGCVAPITLADSNVVKNVA